jgi:hypothetical protein
MLLCDAAQVAEGKLFILGGGWSMTGPGPAPSAIALKMDVPWDQIGQAHHWELFLEDADGRPVMVGSPDGAQPIEIRGELRVDTAPVGLAPGAPVDVALAINLGPLPLEPGSRYLWRLVFDGNTEPDWVLAFTTRPIPVVDET